MNRFEEENDTVRWLPGFVRSWFGLTNEPPKPAGSSWMPGWLRRFLGLTYDEPVRYVDDREVATSAPSPSTVARPGSYTPARSYTPGTASFTVGASRPFAPASYQPAEATSTTPSRLSLAGDELPPDVQPIGYLLRSYARGALPPQGLEAFTREVRATTEKVFGFYGHWIRFQTEELARIGSDLFNAAIDALPGEKTKQQPQVIRRIKVVAENGNGGNAAKPAVEPPATATGSAPEHEG